MSHSSRTPSQLRTQKGEPDVTDHSHPRPEACCWTSRMVLEKFLYILLYHNRKFFNRKRGHIQETCADCILDLKSRKNPSEQSADQRWRFTEPSARERSETDGKPSG